jgi:hypothetical protein
MNDEPRAEQHAEQPYAGIRMRITMDGVEHYLTNPAAEPDPAKWEVDVAFLAAL